MAAGAKNLSKTFVWILMGLLMLGLAGFGAVDLVGSIRIAAQVGNEEVTIDDYVRELQREIRAVQAQTGQALQISDAHALGLDQLALSRLIARSALDHEVGELGVSIGDANLQRDLMAIRDFQGVDGNFDREGYRFAIEQAGLSETKFESDLRKESARTIVQGALMNGVEMPESMTNALTDYIGARRSFTVATVSADLLDEPIAQPTDAQVQAFYDENTALFTLPRTKRLTYVLLSPEAILDTIEIEEEAIVALYDDRKDRFQQPERRLVERLVFADEAAANDALAQIEVGGATFEQLVQDRGLTLGDVDLGDATADDLGDAAEAVFAAGVGDVVGPLPSSLGPALFRINGVLAENITTFEDARAELHDELASERARRLIEAQAEELNDLLAGGATLEELAQESEMELGQIDWTRESSEGVAAYEGFRQIAEVVTESDFPEIDFLDDGSIFALRLDEELAPRPEPLETARPRVNEAWVQQETARALQDQANTVLTRLATDGDFTASGLPFRVENALTRTAFLEDVPADFMSQVFEMEPGELRVVPGDGSALIVRLDETLPPAESDELTQLQQALVQQMNQALAQNIFDIYVRDAQTRARPEIDQRALNAVQTSYH